MEDVLMAEHVAGDIGKVPPNQQYKKPPLPPMENFISEYEKSVGTEISKARKQKRISQKDLAKTIHISVAQLCRIERGISRPSKSTLQRLSGHIGIPYSDLLRYAGYSNMNGNRMLFNKNDKEIDTSSIVYSIYRADSDLLECFQNFDTIGTSENIKVIKVLIHAMRKEVELGNSKKNKETSDRFFLNTFAALKRFIITSLTCLGYDAGHEISRKIL